MTIMAPTNILWRRTQLCPACVAAWPPPTTVPSPTPEPPGPRRRAATSLEHDVREEEVGSGSGSRLPVVGSTRLVFIHAQFSASNSGHSALNLTPPSPALTAPTPLALGFTPAASLSKLPPPVLFHQRVLAAAHLLSVSVACTEPVVISSLVIKDMSPMRMVETSQAGLNDLGWKSDIERQRRVDG